jgi:hypothetical protein
MQTQHLIQLHPYNTSVLQKDYKPVDGLHDVLQYIYFLKRIQTLNLICFP